MQRNICSFSYTGYGLVIGLALVVCKCFQKVPTIILIIYLFDTQYFFVSAEVISTITSMT